MHNGAAESLAAVVADVKHRTDNGRQPDALSDTNDQAKVVKFLESIDVHTVPFVPVQISLSGPYVILSFDTVNGVQYGIETRSTIDGAPSVIGTVPGTGQPVQVQIPSDSTTRFLRLVAQ